MGLKEFIMLGKLKAEKQIQHILLMERITSHQEWPQMGRNLWEIFYESISASTSHLTSEMCTKRYERVPLTLFRAKGERRNLIPLFLMQISNV